MTATQTQSNPAQAPDARPVTAAQHTDARGNVWFSVTRGDETLLETRDEDEANQMATSLGLICFDESLAERDGASDVRELRAALDEMLACHELRAHKGETFTPLQIKAADVARAALQLARGAK